MNLFDKLMTTTVTFHLSDLIIYGLLALLLIAATVCWVLDEPLAYYHKGGKYYRWGFRSGVKEVEE